MDFASSAHPLISRLHDDHPARLSAVDEAWLRMDRPENLMVVTAVMRTGTRLTRSDVEQLAIDRLLPHPRFRMPPVQFGRRVQPADPIELTWHVRRAQPLSDESDEALQGWIASLMREPLPYSRPLWRVHVLEHFGGGSVLVWRLHHALGDGLALMRVLLSAADSPPHVSAVRLATHHRVSLEGMKLVRRGAVSVAKLVGLPRDARTPLTRRPKGEKRVGWTAPVPLERLKVIRRCTQTTVNDVLVSVLSGALHRWFDEHTTSPVPRSIRALVPFDLREREPDEKLGNRFGLVYLSLPVEELTPVERLREVHRRMDKLKHMPEAMVAFGILDVIGRVSPAASEMAIRMFGRKASMVLTNVVGPQEPLKLAGATVDDLLFWVPQAGGVALGFGIISYSGKVRVAVTADRVTGLEPGELSRYFAEELRALEKACAIVCADPASPDEPERAQPSP